MICRDCATRADNRTEHGCKDVGCYCQHRKPIPRDLPEPEDQ
jgi:hypothetical protein